MSEIIEQRIKKCMTDVLEVSQDEITDETSVRSLKTWRGKKHFELVDAFEREFDVRFETAEVETMINYKVIRSTIMAYLDE